jgi:hypothetical protein
MLAYFMAKVTQLLTFSKCQVTFIATLELGNGAQKSRRMQQAVSGEVLGNNASNGVL